MSQLLPATEFKRIHIPSIKGSAIFGVAVTGASHGDTVAVVGPNIRTALRAAERLHKINMQPEGAQEVVLISRAKFEALIAAANIECQ